MKELVCQHACFGFLFGIQKILESLKLIQDHKIRFQLFKTDLSYFYAPGGRIFYIFYLASGILVPILMQKAVNAAKCRLCEKGAVS